MANLPLCLKTLIFAPDNRAPRTREEWFNSSLIMRHFLSTNVGRLVEFVANPMPKTIAASFPINLATRDSSSVWIPSVPTRNYFQQCCRIISLYSDSVWLGQLQPDKYVVRTFKIQYLSLPYSCLVLHAARPYSFTACSESSVQGPEFSANPR